MAVDVGVSVELYQTGSPNILMVRAKGIYPCF